MKSSEIHSILESINFGSDELSQIMATVLNEEYWSALNARSSADRLILLSRESSEDTLERHSRELSEHGYTCLRQWLPENWIIAHHNILERLVDAGWPRVFLFLYASAWEFVTLPSFQQLLVTRLGQGYSLLPNIWVQYVDPVAGQAGFAPHIDGCYSDAVNFWVPLTDARLERASMYVVRRTAQTEMIDSTFADRGTFEPHEVISLLKNAQALPANPGDILVWDNHLIHWGGIYLDGLVPRISMSMVVGHASPGGLALPANQVPSFNERLRFVADALLRFTSRDLSVWPFRRVAEMILANSA